MREEHSIWLLKDKQQFVKVKMQDENILVWGKQIVSIM